MARCRICRSKIDSDFTSHCPDCGASLHPEFDDLIDEPTQTPETGPPPTPFRTRTPRKRSTNNPVGLILVVAAVAAIVGPSIGALREVAPIEDGFDNEWQPSFDMQVGDCLDIEVALVEHPQGADLVSYLHQQECSSPHDHEITAIWSYPLDPQAPYPGQDAILWWSSGGCEHAFETYTGIAIGDNPDLTTKEFLPTEATWEQGGLEMVCLLGASIRDGSDPFPKLVGSRRANDN